MKLRSPWLWALIAVAVLAATAGLSTLRGTAAAPTDGNVPVYEVRRDEFVRKVYADGVLEAVEATVLSPPPTVRGPLRIGWLAEDGSRVSEGDVVIRFDPTDLEKQLTEGENLQASTDARIEQKKVREEGAVRNLDRDAEMADMDLEYAREFQSKDARIFSRIEIIESEIDEQLATERKENAEVVRSIREDLSDVELDLLKIERKKADLQVDQAESDLRELEVTAPHDGIFVLTERWGRVPEVGQVIWGGYPVAEIPQLDAMKAKVFVLEADAGGLEPGVPAKLTLDAHPDRVYDAVVQQVDALAQPRSRHVPVQYFGVTLELARTDPDVMKPGQRVQATLIVGEHANVIAVPRQAVFEVDDRRVAYVRRDGRFEEVEVTLGAAGLGRVVIESGLEEGDRIALRDPTRPLRAPGDDENGGSEKGPARPGAPS
jgi:RND family efflux transporter MFP subunit